MISISFSQPPRKKCTSFSSASKVTIFFLPQCTRSGIGGSPHRKHRKTDSDGQEHLIMTLVKLWGIHAAAVTVWS
jgi:hypothetical protein